MTWVRRAVFLVSVILLPLVQGLTHVRAPDLYESDVYYDLAKYFRGEISIGAAVENAEAGLISHFLLRPVTPFLASLSSSALGLENSFVLVNLIMLILTVFFTYLFTKAVLGEKVAFLACSLLSSLPIVLYYGVGSRIDMGGFMFEPLLAYLAIHWLPRHRGFVWSLLLGTVSGVAILSRENNFFVFLLLVGQALRKLTSPRQLFLTLLAGSSLPVLWMSVTGVTYLVTLNELSEIHGGYEGWLKNPVLAIRSFAGLSVPVVFLSVIGFMFVDPPTLKSLALLGASLLVPMLPLSQVPDVRLTFVLFPVVLPLAGLGFLEFSKSLSNKPILRRLDWNLWAAVLTIFVILYNSYTGLAWFRLAL